MPKDYGFDVDMQEVRRLVEANEPEEAFELLAIPLHEWLYSQQNFEAMHSRTALEKLILAFDYVQMQVGQGGFIQLIQNGYVGLLLTVIEALQEFQFAQDMIAVLDDALKVYALNSDVLDRETTVEEFGRMYAEFREFESLEARFLEAKPGVRAGIFSNLRISQLAN